MPYFMALDEDTIIEEYDIIEDMIQNTTNNDSGKNAYTGRDYVMLQVVASLFNFTIRILPVASWDEVIEKVIERVSFMSPMRIAILPHLLPYLDFSADFEPETLTFVMAKPSLKPRWQSLLYPMSEVVWISICVLLLFMPLVVYLVFHLDNQPGDNRTLGWWTITETVLGTLLGQGLANKTPNTNTFRLLLLSWLVCAFVISVVYRGNLTAFLTLPKYPQRIETLQELVNAKASMLIPPDTIDFYNGFKQSPPGPYKDISQRMTFVPSIQDAFPRLLKENSAYMYERRNLDLNIARHYTRGDGWTPFYAAKENIWPGTCAWPIIRDAPFRHVLDRYIGIFVQAGLVDQWGDEIVYKYRSGATSKERTPQREPENLFGEEAVDTSAGDAEQGGMQPLSVVHLQGPLYLLLLCLLVSSLAFAAEVTVGGPYSKDPNYRRKW
ncbi:ionotropic receptor 21a-like [Palaemon carinicauda]|uniref:ionotropic receptor 21a-like n=1 Tax=Palaemon carinicauda TaxID=392227 RepID=UPI0035B6995E